jgi:hypothetical protein
MTDVFAGEDLAINAWGGNDTVTLREVHTQDDFYVLLGNGNDSLDTQYLRSDELFMDGGNGIDKLTEAYPGNSNKITKVNFEPRGFGTPITANPPRTISAG